MVETAVLRNYSEIRDARRERCFQVEWKAINLEVTGQVMDFYAFSAFNASYTVLINQFNTSLCPVSKMSWWQSQDNMSPSHVPTLGMVIYIYFCVM